MSNIRRLPTPAQRSAKKAAQAVLDGFAQEPDDLVEAMDAPLKRAREQYEREARRAARDERKRIWAGGYNMISRGRYLDICRQLVKLPPGQHSQAAERVFMFLVALIEEGNAEISWSRDDFARELGIQPRHVSSAMTILERLGAVRRERDGRGVVYYVQADVAWNGDLDARKEHLAKHPPAALRAIEGGKA
jgi:DNA-binding transcriptional ArsR family regulator